MEDKEHPLSCDLEHILEYTRDLWEDIRGERIFISGGTGFFGCWLLESFAWINQRLKLGSVASVLTRNPEGFRHKAPHLATDPCLTLVPGDVRNFDFPGGEYPFVIHAATESSAQLIKDDPAVMLSTIVDGTHHMLEFSVGASTQRFLFTSSGAVYGRQPDQMTHVPEDFAGAANPCEASSSYGEGKRVAELHCAIKARETGMTCLIARCFSFVGPYLPLDKHFAIGNFIHDVVSGREIHVKGDGQPLRSYLYAADLAIWLWTILFRGKSMRPYNVGSEEGITILEVAKRVAGVSKSHLDIVQERKPMLGKAVERYVPRTARAQKELGLRQLIQLEDAIERTAQWASVRR